MRHRLWIAACPAFLAAVTLTLWFSVSAAIILFLGLLAGSLLAWGLAGSQASTASDLSPQDKYGPENSKSSEEIFALGKLFEATMSGMREGLLVVDRDMRVVASSEAAHRLFNSRGTLNSQRLTELTRSPAIYGAFLDALKGEERSGVKVETYGSSRRVFDLRVVPLSNGEGNAQGAIGIFFDITRLEKLERVRQEFLSNVSHELRTPLTAILAFVETLESGAMEDTENSRRFLAIIRRNAARMHALIDDILELSAIEAGNVKVQARETELRPVVNDVLTSLAAKAVSQGVTIDNCVDPGAVVFADLSRLEQMLTNLVDNAIKFNRQGGSVSITCESGDRTRILVKDTGDGIPGHHLDRLFERFYRIDRARSREMGGTGLGLAIVKHLARAHGGEVSVTSKLGEGSVFAIDLPRSEQSSESV